MVCVCFRGGQVLLEFDLSVDRDKIDGSIPHKFVTQELLWSLTDFEEFLDK